MNTKKRKNIFIVLSIILLSAASVAYICVTPMSKSTEKQYVYIDEDDDIDSVTTKLTPIAKPLSLKLFSLLSSITDYDKNVRSGRYILDNATSTIQTFRHIRNGIQSPMTLIVPSVRTKERLAHDICQHLMMEEADLLNAMSDSSVCREYGLDTLTIQCLFIPNTYEVYWNVTTDKLLARMKKEYDRFWTDGRLSKAEAAGMTPQEVITLASIVDEETANNGEKPMVAGMYINRLKIDMPLQADPTIKYAWKQFGLKRIYNKLLHIDSPYNTYRNAGLPPGPIRIPSIAGIDAVLNHTKHNYLYMCAKEDFSGTHNFAVTYAEHLKNAKKYTDALNKRGIK